MARRKQVGTIFIKPSERASAPALAKKTGATISIPETGETFSPTTGRFTGGTPVSVSSSSSDQWQRDRAEWLSREPERLRAEAATKAAARAELERARREAIARESARRETARKTFEQALERAKAKKSISAQRSARETFQQSIKSAKESRERTISQVKKVPKVTYEKSIINEIRSRTLESEKKFAKSSTGKIFDVVFGGTLRNRELNRQSSKLDTDIENFNKRFGGRKLSESEFNQAKRIEIDIITRQENIKEKKEKLVQEFRKGAKGFFLGSPLKSSKAERDERIKEIERGIKSRESKLEKRGLSEFKEKQLKGRIKTSEKEISRLRAGGDVIQLATGVVPLAPVGIPTSANVVFVAVQKGKGNKIITDVVFKVGKKRVGIAKGVTIIKGKVGTTFTLGKSGITATKFPTGKAGIVRKQTFAGIEKAVSKIARFKLRGKIKIPRTKALTIVKSNIKGLKQGGFGRVISAKGDKLFKGGKAVKGLRTTDFASISSILTKKDLNLLIGKTITTTGNKAKFIGIVKGTRSVGKLTGVQKAQYQIALKKVVSTIASASAKAKTVSGLTKAQQLVATLQFTKQAIKVMPTLKPTITGRAVQRIKPAIKPKIKPVITRVKTVTKPKVTPALAKGQVTKTSVKQGISQISDQAQKTKQRLKQLQKAKQKTKQKQELRSLQKQQQKFRLKLKTLQVQKQALTQVKFTPKFVPTPAQIRILGLALPKKKKKKKMPKPKKPKQISYHVLARPLKKKGKKIPKLIRVTKRPITKKRAKDLRNYLVDTSLSRTAKIKSSPRKPSKRILKAPIGYASKTAKKFRKYRIVKGKKKPLQSGKVIERKRHLLDTKQEQNKISLKRRIAQLQKQSRKSLTPQQSTFNNRVRTSIKKRKPSPAQLKALANGRAKLKKMRLK